MRLALLLLLLVVGLSPVVASDEGRDWPRLLRFDGGATLVLHQPQVDVWKDQELLKARMAAILEMATEGGEIEEAFGTIAVSMRTVVDMSRQVVLIEEPELTALRFPTLKGEALTRARAYVREALAVGAKEIQLEDLLAVVGPREIKTRTVVVDNTPPAIVIRNESTILVCFDGEPVFVPIEGTDLELALNTPSLLFRQAKTGWSYLLGWESWIKTRDVLSGRWFRTQGDEPLEFCTHELPADFAKIPPEHPAGRVLASVPGTEACREALAANGILHKATVKRQTIVLEEPFKVPPRFAPIEGTEAEFALDLDLDVFRVSGKYFCCADGIWFEADVVNGPWRLCDAVPETLYAIPPGHAAFNDTFVVVESATPEAVTYAHTAGYYGSYPADGVVVWGTGTRFARPAAFWMDSWKNLPYWIERWNRDELHQWHRHLTYGEGRWYDHLTGIYRVGFDAMSHAKVRRHRADAFRSWGGKAVLPATERRAPEPEPAPAKPTKTKATVTSSRGDLYSGPDGQVYKREHSDWFVQKGAKWVHLSGRPWLESDEKKRQARLKKQAQLQRSYDARKRSRHNRRYRSRGRRGIAYWARQPGWGWCGGGGGVDIGGGGTWGGGGGGHIGLGGW